MAANDDLLRLVWLDDDPEFLEVVTARVRGLGYEVEPVSQRAGLDAALRRLARPDLVVTDLRFPERDGARFLLQVRSSLRPHRIPILVVSGHPIASQLAAAWADGFVAKPFRFHELMGEIRRIIGSPVR